jgi:hypothetical protein
MIRTARSIQSVRRESGLRPERRRRKFRPETLRPTNGRLRKIDIFRAGSGEWWTSIQVHPPKGSGVHDDA